MKNRNQRGFSFWNMMIYIAFFGGLILVGMKLIPAYLESMKIDNAIDVLNREGTAGMTRGQIKDSLVQQFDIDAVETITYANFESFVTITPLPNGAGHLVEVAYEREIPLIANISLLARFDKSAQ